MQNVRPAWDWTVYSLIGGAVRPNDRPAKSKMTIATSVYCARPLKALAIGDQLREKTMIHAVRKPLPPSEPRKDSATLVKPRSGVNVQITKPFVVAVLRRASV